MTDAGFCELALWKEESQAGVVQLGWVHSHHGLPQQPSAADLKQQVVLQTLAPNSVMVVLKPGCSAQAWTIPRGIFADLRVAGVDSSYPATDSLEAVALQPRRNGPVIEVVIIGRQLDLAAACGACLGLEGDQCHTMVAGACSKAQLMATPSLRGGAEAAGEPGMATPSSRGGAEAAGEPGPIGLIDLATPPSRGGAEAASESGQPARTVQRASSEQRAHRMEPGRQRVRAIRRVASDDAALQMPAPAQTSSIDAHNENMLLAFFRKMAAQQKGTLVLKNLLMKTPLPLGAQTIEQANKSWAASMKSLKDKKKFRSPRATGQT